MSGVRPAFALPPGEGPAGVDEDDGESEPALEEDDGSAAAEEPGEEPPASQGAGTGPDDDGPTRADSLFTQYVVAVVVVSIRSL